MNRFFAPGAEFSGIERMFSAARFARDGRGLGDDAFVWDPQPGEIWVSSMDASIAGVHFRPDWMTRPEALRKALLSNLSDLNAMGARTRFALFALCATPAYTPETFEALGAALRALEDAHGFKVVGGDTTRSPDAEVFTFTVFGVVEGAPLLRSGARPGHKVYVSGTLGGSSGGLWCYKDLGTFRREPMTASERSARDALMQVHREPGPPLALGPLLSTLNAARAAANDSLAAIDLSDGLSSELWHLARQSGCAITIDFERLPAHAALGQAGAIVKNDRRAHLLHGGEDYQLLFTGAFTEEELARLRAVAPITEIGSVTEGEGVFLKEGGATNPLAAGGWSHG